MWTVHRLLPRVEGEIVASIYKAIDILDEEGSVYFKLRHTEDSRLLYNIRIDVKDEL